MRVCFNLLDDVSLAVLTALAISTTLLRIDLNGNKLDDASKAAPMEAF